MGLCPGGRGSDGEGGWRSRWTKFRRVLSAGDNGGQRPRSPGITILKARCALGPHVGAFFKCNDAWVPPPKTVGPRHQYSL